ncbi:hypothetical protein NXC14_PA00250 (plasmid) [Rhizobium sp. NXC14]|nr:hypothetical protein NXC14_PA00250 [Rhizobium sp. NXC14]
MRVQPLGLVWRENASLGQFAPLLAAEIGSLAPAACSFSTRNICSSAHLCLLVFRPMMGPRNASRLVFEL